jgi:hypothetical protein
VNTTGRNDIIESKVARDAENLYFYAKTREDLTPHTDAGWMLLYIDADQNKSTGWEGYDFLVNSEIPTARATILRSWKKDDWGKAVEVSYAYAGNELMIAIPRKHLKGDSVAIDFHWADNIQKMNDITEFFLNGDNAPERRSNYRYHE